MESQIKKILQDIDEGRSKLIDKLKKLSLEQLNLDLGLEGKKVTLRRQLLHIIDHERMHVDQILKTRRKVRGYSFPEALPNEIERIIIKLQEAHGEFIGVLHSLTDDDLDKDPGEGKWTIRQILQHLKDSGEVQISRLEKV